MEIFRSGRVVLEAADARTFGGRARIKRLASARAGTPVAIYWVEFEDGGRTNWHTHSGAQWLLVVDGGIRVQRWGAQAEDVEAGDAVLIAPGEKHWHGAVPGVRGVHLAINVDAATEWLEPVTDDQYAS